MMDDRASAARRPASRACCTTLSPPPEASLKNPEVSTSRAGRAPAATPRAARCVPRLVPTSVTRAEWPACIAPPRRHRRSNREPARRSRAPRRPRACARADCRVRAIAPSAPTPILPSPPASSTRAPRDAAGFSSAAATPPTETVLCSIAALAADSGRCGAVRSKPRRHGKRSIKRVLPSIGAELAGAARTSSRRLRVNPQPFRAPRKFFARRIAFDRLQVKSHGAVYLHHRRRGLLARQGSGFGGARRAAAGARLFRAPAQARPLSQRRSGHDEPDPARRGVRHRRRRRDRPRPRPLRALHRPHRPTARTTSPPGASTRS